MPYDMAWLVGRERERRTEQQVLKSCTAELLAVMVSHVIEQMGIDFVLCRERRRQRREGLKQGDNSIFYQSVLMDKFLSFESVGHLIGCVTDDETDMAVVGGQIRQDRGHMSPVNRQVQNF